MVYSYNNIATLKWCSYPSQTTMHHNSRWRCSGVENVSDHGTIGPRKSLGLPENISSFRSKKELLARHKGKFLFGRKYIELENDKN